MALVIWLFAGGGEAELGNREHELRGIVGFFQTHFPDFHFRRITPVSPRPPRKGESPIKAINSLGKTGESLAKQIKVELEYRIKHSIIPCDVILVIDDLDCACNINRKQLFNDAIDNAGKGEFKAIKRIIGFASPELESWIIADWENTVAKYIDFRKNQKAMQHWLSYKNVSFQNPENFSSFDERKKSCKEKLSELLIESSKQDTDSFIGQIPYSKSKHSPELLIQLLNPDIVSQKCPLFRDFFTQLQNCNNGI